MRKRKPHVDQPVPSERRSAREKDAAHEAPAGDSRAEGTAGRDAAAFADAAAFIGKGARADEGDATDPQRSGIEQRRAEEWARAKGCLIDDRELDSLLLLSNSTSEHEVWYRDSDNRAVKRTWPGFFGQVPIWKAGRLDRAPAEGVIPIDLQKAVIPEIIRAKTPRARAKARRQRG